MTFINIIFILFLLCSSVHAEKCIYKSKEDQNEILIYKVFKDKKQAEKYAVERHIENNIIIDKDHGYYVFDYLPSTIFTCNIIEK